MNTHNIPEIREAGRDQQGKEIYSERRLWMQLRVFTDIREMPDWSSECPHANLPVVILQSALDPAGIGVLTWSEDESYFVSEWSAFLRNSVFASYTALPEYTMMGRSYTIGYEQELDEVLVDRPISRALNPAWPWQIWYPLKRKNGFYRLPEDHRKKILSEHGRIGFAYGSQDYGHDIRLASFGVDAADNDFTIALIGPRLAPLSKLVETMRSTEQTGEHMERMGPFFIGKAVYRQAGGHA